MKYSRQLNFHNILFILLQYCTPFSFPCTMLESYTSSNNGNTCARSVTRHLTLTTLGIMVTWIANTTLFLAIFFNTSSTIAASNYNNNGASSHYSSSLLTNEGNTGNGQFYQPISNSYYGRSAHFQSLLMQHDQQPASASQKVYYSPSQFQSAQSIQDNSNILSSSSSSHLHRFSGFPLNSDANIYGSSDYQHSNEQILSSKPTCPNACSCADDRVICRDRGLTEIPLHIPETVTELRLELNRIREIPSKAFSRFKQLRRIDLNNNELVKIASDAFYGLKYLHTLILYGNSITELGQGIFKGLTSLELLLLNANNISCILTDLFADLQNVKLLSLYDNHIQSLANGTFDGLKSIQTMHLGNNPFICDCNLKWIGSYLRQNQVETSDALCAEPKRVAKRRLSTLDLDKYKCKGSEQFRTKFAGHCVVDERCPAECDCEGSLVNCSGRQLADFPQNLPLYTTILRLSDNRIKKIPANGIFKRLKHLVSLDLKRNQIELIEEGTFIGASSLNELVLSENRIRHLNSKSLVGLKNLEFLSLRLNKLTCIVNNTFEELEHLRLLSLYENDLKCLQPGAFNGLRSLGTLNLVNNPLSCTCNLQWFSKFLNSPENTLVTGDPTCASPPTLRGLPIQDVKENDFGCPPNEHNLVEMQTNCNLQLCPAQCSCHGKYVRCSKRKLNEFPRYIDLHTTELYLDVNDIKEIPARINQLSNLVKLDLSNNRLTILQDYIFYNLTKLETLILSFNKLKCIQSFALSGLTQLRILSLHANDLSTLPEETFRDLININHVALGSNPFYCDCKLGWLSDWVKKGYNEVGIARCAEPSNMSNKLLLSTPTEQFICSKDNIQPASVLSKCDICYSFPCLNNGVCKQKQLNRSSIGHLKKSNLNQLNVSSLSSVSHSFLNLFYSSNANPETEKNVPSSLSLYMDSALDPADTLLSDDANILSHKLNKDVLYNGIQIMNASELFSYTCECDQGYFGINCEQRIDACFGNPCTNNGTCQLIDENNFICLCLPGFTGSVCETNIDDCLQNECKNGARCLDEINSYSCECQPGYTGKLCEQRFEYCSSPKYNPCQNGATCLPINRLQPPARNTHELFTLNDYQCECTSGFTGRNCTEDIDECATHLCQNGARCLDGINSYTCQCINGYVGKYCEQFPEVEQLAKTSPCQQNECGNGVCFQSNPNNTDYYCKCSAGYTGRRCDIFSSITFHSGQAYLQFGSLDFESSNNLNVTLELITKAENGILLYVGQTKASALNEILNIKNFKVNDLQYNEQIGDYHKSQHHLAVELYHGRIRVSLNLANHSTATMFSYELVNNGQYHVIKMQLKKNVFSLQIDDGKIRSIKSEAVADGLLSGAPIFIGGLSNLFAFFATKHRHVWHEQSFLGCMRKLKINNQLIDIQMSLKQQRVTPGCVQFSNNANEMNVESKNYQFVANSPILIIDQLNDEQSSIRTLHQSDLKESISSSKSDFYKLRNRKNKNTSFKTVSSSTKSSNSNNSSVSDHPKCTLKVNSDFYREKDCVSSRKYKITKCEGVCQSANGTLSTNCCRSVRNRNRTVKMRCTDGSSYIEKIKFVRKCACSSTNC